jgi:hypothetical protein
MTNRRTAIAIALAACGGATNSAPTTSKPPAAVLSASVAAPPHPFVAEPFRVCLDGAGEIVGLAVSETQLAVSHGVDGLVLFDRATKKRAATFPRSSLDLRFSPDGKEIAAVVTTHSNTELEVVDVQSGDTRVLARNIHDPMVLQWSDKGITFDNPNEILRVDPRSGAVVARGTRPKRTATDVGLVEWSNGKLTTFDDDFKPLATYVPAIKPISEVAGEIDKRTVLVVEHSGQGPKSLVVLRDGVRVWELPVGELAFDAVLTMPRGSIAVVTEPNYRDEGSCGVLVIDPSRAGARRVEGPKDCVALAEPQLAPDGHTLFAEVSTGRRDERERCVIALDLAAF